MSHNSVDLGEDTSGASGDDGAGVDPELFMSTDEPELEFDVDGTELSSTKEAELDAELDEGFPENDIHVPHLEWNVELTKEADKGAFRSGAITPDGIIDEDFEKALGTPPEEDGQSEFSDVEKYGIIEVAGDDMLGRKVIVISACKLPSNKTFDHQRLLMYIRYTLDQYVEVDYVIVYFHYGLTSRNKPRLGWLMQAYREFDRKYKKNLKALYLVHPTNFIKILWNIFRPVISAKFGRKMMYVDYLMELKNHLHFDQLSVPPPVLEYDAKKVASRKPHYPYDQGTSEADGRPLKTQQFGVTLQYIKENTGRIVPPVVEETIEYLRANGLEVEGIFRRSANAVTLKEVQKKYNKGESVDFSADGYDVHTAAVLLKTFLRELQEPILTFDLFEPVTRLNEIKCHDDALMIDSNKHVFEAERMLREELPEDNYVILKYIIQFLKEVTSKSDVNKMTPMNLAIVFGPNLLWSKGQANLSTMGAVNSFALILIKNCDDVFVR